MSVVNASATAIEAALKVGYYYRFQNDELAHISGHSELSDGEKLVWINLSARAKQNRSFSCKATQAQIADMVGKKTNTVQKILRGLEQKGFLVAEHDAMKRVTLYSVQFDDIGLEKLSNVSKRGEYGAQKAANFESTRIEIPVWGGRKSASEADKNPTLLLNINNNNKKHLDHNKAEVIATQGIQMTNADAMIFEAPQEASEPIQIQVPDFESVEALIAKKNEIIESLRAQNPNLSRMDAILRASAQLPEGTKERIKAYYDQQAEIENLQQRQEAAKAREAKILEKQRLEDAKPKKSLESDLVHFEMGGEQYAMEAGIKARALFQLQSLFSANRITGDARQKSLANIYREVFFYLTKSGALSKEPISQEGRLNTAISLLIRGRWQTPKGLAKQDSINRERSWEVQKKAEQHYAANVKSAVQDMLGSLAYV